MQRAIRWIGQLAARRLQGHRHQAIKYIQPAQSVPAKHGVAGSKRTCPEQAIAPNEMKNPQERVSVQSRNRLGLKRNQMILPIPSAS